MPTATHTSLHLVRFDALTDAGPVDVEGLPGVLFCKVGADVRAAATEPSSRRAYAFLILAHHDSAESAQRLVDEGLTRAPWLAGAREVWAAALQPFRHKGAANHLDPENPGPLFAPLAPAPPPTAPFVAVTSVGWDLTNPDRSRILTFSNGVVGVRMSMTAVDGLYSQQTFTFDGALDADPCTVTFWRDHDAAVAFAYGPGVHRDQMARYRTEELADRTSFTRFLVLSQTGTWRGRDPLDFGDGR